MNRLATLRFFQSDAPVRIVERGLARHSAVARERVPNLE